MHASLFSQKKQKESKQLEERSHKSVNTTSQGQVVIGQITFYLKSH